MIPHDSTNLRAIMSHHSPSFHIYPYIPSISDPHVCTSRVKSTCPGVSTMLIRCSFQKAVVAALVMVIPRSCSCSIQSMVAWWLLGWILEKNHHEISSHGWSRKRVLYMFQYVSNWKNDVLFYIPVSHGRRITY